MSRAKEFLAQLGSANAERRKQEFEVDGIWQAWRVNGLGEVVYDMQAQHPPRTRMLGIKRFDVDEYRRRTGQEPTGVVPIRQIGYWTHRGNFYFPAKPPRAR